ncbi:MAG: urease accessory protein [Deltaproteobacteria bacterium]|nr:urease accessory protein [Deltaproteobacteria bacterium]
MDEIALTAWTLGLALGVRHALEPDHLAAVSTLVADQRGSRAGLVLGALWGAGHTSGLLLLGGVLAVLQRGLPPGVGALLEACVGVMLCALGARALWGSLRHDGVGTVVEHRHGPHRHAHPAPGEHVHLGQWTLLRRPLLVGVVHGLAGSGALVALAIAGARSAGERLGFIAMFGLGSVAGMTVLSALAGAGLQRYTSSPRVSRWVAGVAGAVSLVLGSVWGSAAVWALVAG